MRIKKFTGTDIRSVMDQVKSEFGEEAIILHSKTTSGPGLRGLVGASSVEVTAAVDLKAEGPGGSPRKTRNSPVGKHPETIPTGRGDQAVLLETISRMETRINELSDRLEWLSGTHGSPAIGPYTPVPPDWMSLYKALADWGFPLSTAHELIQKAAGQAPGEGKPEDRAREIKKVIASRFTVAGPIRLVPPRPRIVALIGATGVGKTTTLAKIAALMHKEGHRVGFLTADTYRIAAVDQLQRYAEILESPLEVVYEAGEIPKALERLAGADLVLVDTAGRSQRHADQVEDLDRLLRSLPDPEIHLLLSATTNRTTQREQVSRFGNLGAHRVIFTKLDELSHGSDLLDLARVTALPLSYVTNGQEVPRDIRVAEPLDLARLVLSIGRPSYEKGNGIRVETV